MSGLGLDDFLNHNQGSAGGKYLDWKKEGKIEVWLSTRAAIAYPVWSHRFPILTAKEVEKDGEKVEEISLFRPRWVGPDVETIYKEQYFRWSASDSGPTDMLKRPPVKDPFLLLREYLRREILDGRMSENDIVFRFENPRPREWESAIEEWRAGHLAKLMDTTKATWSHTLDAKLEYVFVVCDNEHPENGLSLTWAAKLLGEQMQKTITEQMESNGRDEGNPLLNPYCFRWTYDKNAKSFSDSYRAYRYNKAKLTDEIRAAINNPDFPDATPLTRPSPGDKMKLLAAMQDAAVMDLPWDQIFVPAWKDDGGDDATDFDFGANTGSTTMGGEKKATRAPKTETKKTETSSGTGRRKRADKPEPKPEPKIEIIACEECEFPMNARWNTCPNCGAAYDIEGDSMDPPPIEKLEKAKWREKYAAAAAPEPEPEKKTNPNETGIGYDECWACQTKLSGGEEHCPGCGIDLGDDIPNA